MADDFTFLNHVRFGLSTGIVAGPGARAVLDVELTVAADGTGQPVALQPVEVYGPGDVAGFDARALLKTEPRDGSVDFDSTAMAAVDFSDEDFPWRYTPMAEALIGGVTGGRLTPWISLLVLSDDEYRIENGALVDVPVHATPDPSQAWAWAHVQSDTPIAANGDIEAGRTALRDALAANPGVAFARLLCPRRLSANTTYRGFVVPTFETGRLAGLGMPTDGVAGSAFAWADPRAGGQTPPPLPIYFQFGFRTGQDGDFESLVRRLKPWVAKPEDNLGRRLMDMTPWPGDPHAGTVSHTPALWLEGALRTPLPGPQLPGSARDPLPGGGDPLGRWGEGDRAAFTAALEPRLDAGLGRTPAPDAAADPNAEPDDQVLPLITPPVYGAGHAAVRAADGTAPGRPPRPWIADLNLDPGYRVSAGFGTRDVQRGQDRYMASAWSQYGDLFAINRLLTTGQFWRATTQALFARAVPVSTTPHDHVRTLSITRPADAVTPYSGANLRSAVARTTLSDGLVGGAFARVARANGVLARRAVSAAALAPAQAAAARATLVSDAVSAVADRQIVIEPVMLRPSGRILLGVPPAPVSVIALNETLAARPEVAARLGAQTVASLTQYGADIRQASRRRIPLREIEDNVRRLGRELVGGAPVGEVVRKTQRSVLQFGLRALGFGAQWVTPPYKSGLSTAALSASAFTRARLDDGLIRDGAAFTKRLGVEPNDKSWKNLQGAVAAVQARVDLDLKYAAPARPTADLAALAAAARATVEPNRALTERMRAVLDLGDLLFPERLDPIMPAPEFKDPMQVALAPPGKEDRLLPNIAAIPNNSVTLLENNQAFIEAYMAGLNHEMARELLWREYPTDGRGSYFRRFWDTESCPGLTEDQKDTIKMVHGWRGRLGDHPANAAVEDAAVVTVRGDLLRRYPNTDIFAVRAWWIPQSREGLSALDLQRLDAIAARFPTPGLSKWLRVPHPSEWNALEFGSAPPDISRWPIFRGKASDCTFIGLPITPEEMLGDDKPPGDPGWYVVLRERVGEPRFGADDNYLNAQGGVVGAPLKTNLASWNDLDWEHYGLAAGSLALDSDRWRMLDLGRSGQPSVGGRTLAQGHAGDIAGALLQRPVQVYIHASELLPEPGQ